MPLCQKGLCSVIDLREAGLIACNTSEQCRLRWGTGCCEYCASVSDMIVAVNTEFDYRSVCPSDLACPPCVPPPFPTDVKAVCTTEQRCEVRRILE